ncbi:leucyl aminopeptidase [Paenibacillus yanchengensis]|uniref:Probable cytosol aminopeptidase n=1 Tax=Paenibacillus yanchengensis TaxID=2035833 RepID=A0ABW4YFH0_9BACL
MQTTLMYQENEQLEQSVDVIVYVVTKNSIDHMATEPLTSVAAINEQVQKAIVSGQFKCASEATLTLPTYGMLSANYVVFAYLENREDMYLEAWRVMAAGVARAAKAIQAKTIQLILKESIFAEVEQNMGTISVEDSAAIVQAVMEGLLLTLHTRVAWKKEMDERFVLDKLTLVPEWADEEVVPTWFDQAAWEQAMNRAQVITEAVGFARDLVNKPGNELTPELLAEEAERIALELELDIEVMDEWTAAELGMGGLLGVGQGSVNPPRMIVMHYRGNPDSEEVYGLVGKGITFDTGGISLKTAAGMEEMISDMGGAAAVLSAIKALATLKAAINVVVVIPTAENMPSDRALKPGDVIQTMSGYTVEVVNTDAEGRLVLADGLTVAIARGATKIIDVATLTGAVSVAIGIEASAAITNNEPLLLQLIAASNKTGERIWPLPAYDEYKKLLKSEAADLKNVGGRQAGTITGGLFVGHFAENLPWVHLDIAGTAWLGSNRKYETKGGTGVMVRTLVELLSTSL